MNAAVKLAGFAAVLAVVFGGAVLVGDALDPDAPGASETSHAVRDEAHAAETASGGHAGMSDAGAPAPRGLAVAADGLRLDLQTPQARRGVRTSLRFRILDSAGDPVRRFGVTHTRRMHAIVVRRDLTGFQHLHPRMAADGTWSTPVRLPDAGSYRVFADFTPVDGAAVTLASDLRVDGDARLRGLPAPATTAASGAYAVHLDRATARAGEQTTLRFTITRAGRPVHVQPYLGAGGHLVALREGDLAFLHVHPSDHAGGHPGAISFETTLPTPGRYRLFLQFRHAGRVHTVAFTREAA